MEEKKEAKAAAAGAFYDLQHVPRSKFSQVHVRSNICSRYFAIFVYRFIRVVNRKTKEGEGIEVGDVVDVNSLVPGQELNKTKPQVDGADDQTQHEVQKFQQLLAMSVAKHKKQG